MGMLQKLQWVVMAVCFFTVSHMLSSNEHLKAKAVEALQFMHHRPGSGAVLHFVLSVTITVSGIPFALVDIAVAIVYPFHVTLVMLFVAKTTGSATCFFVARHVLSVERQTSIRSHQFLGKVNVLVKGHPIYFGTLIRFSTVPALLKNYGLPLLEISFLQYMVCCALGSVVFVPLQAYMGATIGPVLLGLHTEQTEDQLVVTLMGMLFGVGASLLGVRHVVAALLSKHVEEPHSEKSA